MKKILILLVTMLMTSMGSFAQADKIIGVYKTVRNGVNSKIRVTKKGNTYQAQVIWVDNLHNPDGTIKRDDKNPDASKRNIPADQIVLIESVTYNDGKWEKGRIYDPTKGKTYRVVLDFKSPTSLRVRGYLGPFSESMYWTKIE